MTFVLLHADRLATVVSDDPLVPAAERAALDDAFALLAEARTLRDAAAEALDEARARGLEEGRAEGVRQGKEAAAEEHRGELFRLALRDGEERRARQAEISGLALEVVRRIAGDLGDGALVAGLAERAVRDLAPDTTAVVRVAPANVAAVQARIGTRGGIAVEPDDGVAAADCVVETALGRTHAGLETQLAQIAAVWGGKTDG